MNRGFFCIFYVFLVIVIPSFSQEMNKPGLYIYDEGVFLPYHDFLKKKEREAMKKRAEFFKNSPPARKFNPKPRASLRETSIQKTETAQRIPYEKAVSTPVTASAAVPIKEEGNTYPKTYKPFPPIIRALSQRKIEEAKKLIKEQASISEIDREGNNSLTWACKFGDDETIDLLLQKGVEINQVDGIGATPLHYAARQGRLNIVKKLVEKGAKFDLGTPILIEAAVGNNFEIVRFLVELGAKVDIKNKVGLSPILSACSTSNLEMIKFLIAKGGNIHDIDQEGGGALFFACVKGNPEIVQFLIDSGFDPNLADKYGVTPLHRAVFFKHAETVKILLKGGGNPNLKNKSGTSSFEFAKRNNDKEMLQILKSPSP